MTDSPTAKTPREMSSRLLTMKFMQRAVASTASSPTTPTTPKLSRKFDEDNDAEDPDEPSAKRRRTLDRAAVEAALREREAGRQAALEKHTGDLGDTHWVLDAPASTPSRKAAGAQQEEELKVVYVGYEEIDERSGSGATAEGKMRVSEDGRIRTANFKRRDEKTQDKKDESSDSDSSDSDSRERSRGDKKPPFKNKSGGGFSAAVQFRNGGGRHDSRGNDRKRKKSFPMSISANGMK